MVVAPHAWTRVELPSVNLMAINASDWCDNFLVGMTGEDHVLTFSNPYPTKSAGYRMKFVDGGMLLFQSQDPTVPVVIVAPHAWTRVKTDCDFTK